MRTNKLAGVIVAAVLLAMLGGVVAFAATGGNHSWSSGWQMMGGRYVYRPATPTTVSTLPAARSEAQLFATRLGLRVDEVMQFQRNFYAKLVDHQGTGATEVLVDKASGVVSIEYGPAMMWNTRYGMGHAGASMMGSYGASMMGGSGYQGMMDTNRPGATSGNGYGSMMGGSSSSSRSGYGSRTMGGSGSGYGGMMGGSGSTTQTPTAPSSTATRSLSDARTLVQRWLDSNERGVQVETGGDAFPGYYTLETLKGGKITGMISVNATGAVWPHWWHGAFVAKSA
jgi:hypothetical protein